MVSPRLRSPARGAANVPIVGGVAKFQTSLLITGIHAITADYSGAPGFSASSSAEANVVVAASPPRVISITPNGNIAELYLKLGRREEAKKHYEEYLALYPNSPKAGEIRKTLETLN